MILHRVTVAARCHTVIVDSVLVEPRGREVRQ